MQWVNEGSNMQNLIFFFVYWT